MSRSLLLTSLNCLAVCLCFNKAVSAQVVDNTTRPATDKADDPFVESRRAAANITVQLNGQELELQPGPLYTYDEVIDRWRKGTSWVWGAEGRPPLLLNTMTLDDVRYYEFMSLTPSKLSVDTGYGAQWLPKPSWNPKPIQDAPEPAQTRRARLIQMRNLARQFTAEQTQGPVQPVQRLRLLPQPIYRYAKESDESLDGAIFGFLREGDLETILVIEAVKNLAACTNATHLEP
jgi:hypothetical protein